MGDGLVIHEERKCFDLWMEREEMDDGCDDGKFLE